MDREKLLSILIPALGIVAAAASAVAIKEWRANGSLRAQLAERARAEQAVPAPEPATREPATPAAVPAAPEPAADEDVDLSAYNDEMARLQALVAHRDQTITQLRDQLNNLESRPAPERKSRAERRKEYMEKLKAENPAKYREELQRREEREQRRADFRERISTHLDSQISYFSDIDVASLPEELQENHQKILDTLGEFQAMMNKEGERTREERREMFGKMRGLREAFETERAVLLYDVGRNLGYNDDDAWVFVEHVHQITDMTSVGGMFRGGRGGRGGRGSR